MFCSREKDCTIVVWLVFMVINIFLFVDTKM
jgi:hypothetical protein